MIGYLRFARRRAPPCGHISKGGIGRPGAVCHAIKAAETLIGTIKLLMESPDFQLGDRRQRRRYECPDNLSCD